VFVDEKEYMSGQFVQDEITKEWKVRLVRNGEKVRWIGGDVTRKDDVEQQAKYPLLQYTSPITVRVKPDEMIYIPSLWLHHVTQVSSKASSNHDDAVATIAVNYWYEMNFSSPLYVYFHLLQQMKYIKGIFSSNTLQIDHKERDMENDKADTAK
jgi:Cupin-like domain